MGGTTPAVAETPFQWSVKLAFKGGRCAACLM
uniref:Uncharacterized protein n=1 Tax=Anguilla anguilla TaxID=7936 RepID=A0A0E9UX70_ANGAN